MLAEACRKIFLSKTRRAKGQEKLGIYRMECFETNIGLWLNTSPYSHPFKIHRVFCTCVLFVFS